MKALEDDVMNIQHFLVQVVSSCVTHYRPTAGSSSHKRMYIKFIKPQHTSHQQSSEQAFPIPAGWYTAPETCSTQTCLPSKVRSWQKKQSNRTCFLFLIKHCGRDQLFPEDHHRLKHRGYLNLVKNRQKNFEEDHQIPGSKPWRNLLTIKGIFPSAVIGNWLGDRKKFLPLVPRAHLKPSCPQFRFTPPAHKRV